jgi:hypothetical protein
MFQNALLPFLSFVYIVVVVVVVVGWSEWRSFVVVLCAASLFPSQRRLHVVVVSSSVHTVAT